MRALCLPPRVVAATAQARPQSSSVDIRAYFSVYGPSIAAHIFLISRYTRISTSRSFKGPGSPYASHKIRGDNGNTGANHTLTLRNISSPPKEACTSTL